MTCNEAAEFISALYDGETIPRTAAEHIGACEICRTRMTDYLELGVELRRVASLESVKEVMPRTWNKQHGMLTNWWRKGWEMMRIPRLAFASLLAGIVALGSSLVLVGVHAHTQGPVVMLKIAPASDHPAAPCPLSTVDKEQATCAALIQLHSKNLFYEFKLLSKQGDSVELGVRIKVTAGGPAGLDDSTFENEPQKQYSFQPGETLQVDAPGLGTMAVTGEWTDHMPSVPFLNSPDLDAGPDELRILSPLLLRDKTEVGDLGGTSTTCTQTGAVELYFPGDGLYELSLSPLQGAVQGRISLNRISFEADGQAYTFLMGAPLARSEHIWIRRDANFKPSAGMANGAYLSSSEHPDHLLSNAPAANQ